MPVFASAPPPIWDIFCRVVDNYGDIGVCWRLARQLAGERGLQVRLWVDDLLALEKLRGPTPEKCLSSNEIKVFTWDQAESEVSPGDVVIEAFACELPQSFLARMALQVKAPLWINLEYLSAERWVEACHGLPSPHPSLPLRKFFFFPGFTPATGGLLREQDLLARRDAFQSDPAAVQAWWASMGGKDCWGDRLNLSLFTYEVAGIGAWLDRLAGGARPVRLLVPEGRALAAVASWFGEPDPRPGQAWRRGQLACHVLPFVAQPDYDALLWACDVNLVRGEDSFVRAQWAGRPFLWHIYQQDEAAHVAKLEAFLARYRVGLEAGPASALADFWRAWDRQAGLDAVWTDFMGVLPELAEHARAWAWALAEQPDLVRNLVNFCAKAV
ncbi:MAG: elongation factor P maturation arginine rhamnosyltransferase EarP [Rhodocyclaceae bacterium]|jgi:uncharacterized repeat protein (TIGR03837 family)|nr:elongation factor P maturation arginine rhamnosyltransferase EarP [Rhodocyclaceae bacterium]